MYSNRQICGGSLKEGFGWGKYKHHVVCQRLDNGVIIKKNSCLHEMADYSVKLKGKNFCIRYRQFSLITFYLWHFFFIILVNCITTLLFLSLPYLLIIRFASHLIALVLSLTQTGYQAKVETWLHVSQIEVPDCFWFLVVWGS